SARVQKQLADAYLTTATSTRSKKCSICRWCMWTTTGRLLLIDNLFIASYWAWEEQMITIMGASGKTGRAAAEALLEQGKKVRVIARSRDHLKTLIDRGAEAAIGN